jgi:hypothetical protein
MKFGRGELNDTKRYPVVFDGMNLLKYNRAIFGLGERKMKTKLRTIILFLLMVSIINFLFRHPILGVVGLVSILLFLAADYLFWTSLGRGPLRVVPIIVDIAASVLGIISLVGVLVPGLR